MNLHKLQLPSILSGYIGVLNSHEGSLATVSPLVWCLVVTRGYRQQTCPGKANGWNLQKDLSRDYLRFQKLRCLNQCFVFICFCQVTPDFNLSKTHPALLRWPLHFYFSSCVTPSFCVPVRNSKKDSCCQRPHYVWICNSYVLSWDRILSSHYSRTWIYQNTFKQLFLYRVYCVSAHLLVRSVIFWPHHWLWDSEWPSRHLKVNIVQSNKPIITTSSSKTVFSWSRYM